MTHFPKTEFLLFWIVQVSGTNERTALAFLDFCHKEKPSHQRRLRERNRPFDSHPSFFITHPPLPVLVLWSPFMGLVPMGLLLHSHRSLHEIRMALHEIHEIRSRMVRVTRLLQAQHSGQLNQIALTFLRVFSCRGRGVGKTRSNEV